MTEYIERERLLSFERFDREVTGEEHTAEDILMMIQTAPAAKVAPVRHGRWIIFNDGTEDNPQNDHIRCSVCGQYWSEPKHRQVFRYCPNCGAKMDCERREK